MQKRLSALSRLLLSWSPRVGFRPSPQPSREGISAIVRVGSGEEWVEPSIRSLESFADQIIVLKHNVDEQTNDIVDQFRTDMGDRLMVCEAADIDFFELTNLGMEMASCRWLFKWDADFIARTSGERSILHLKDFLLDLDPRRFYVVQVAAVELDGDLFHQIPDRRIRFDPEVFTSGDARYVGVRKRVQRLASLDADSDERWRDFTMQYDTLKVPKYYRIIRWGAACLFHLNIKSALGMLLRYYWLEWLARGSVEFPTVEQFALSRIGDELGTDDLQAAAARFTNEYVQLLRPCADELVGDYPEPLGPYLEDPKYRIVYRDGQIVGRNDTFPVPDTSK